MAPEGNSERYSRDNDGRPGSDTADTSAAEAALKAKLSRKRTKTGCLTCRRRRIKCGEERPVCKNCIKSKRHCEGYSQRVVFKPPTFEYHPAPNGGAHIIFQAGPVPVPTVTRQEVRPPFTDNPQYAQLRPRHAEQPSYMTPFDSHVQQYAIVEQQPAQTPSLASHFRHDQQTFQFAPELSTVPGQSYPYPTAARNDSLGGSHLANPRPQHVVPPVATLPSSQPMRPSMIDTASHTDPAPTLDPELMPPVTTVATQYLAHMYDYDQTVLQASQQFSFDPGYEGMNPYLSQHWTDSKPPDNETRIASTPASGHSSATIPFAQTPTLISRGQWAPSTYTSRPELSRPIDYHYPAPGSFIPWSAQVNSGPNYSQLAEHTAAEMYEHEAQVLSQVTPTHMLSAAAVETQDDDYYDVESDEETDIDASAAAEQHGYERQQTLSRMLVVNHISSHQLQTRRYDTFIYEGILDRYRVEEVASPLRNSATARVFAHFISATGPSLSIFERHPRNTSVLFNEGSIPPSQQGLWTYRMPMLALRNQGLLHAMLALASLHIARLQDTSVTPSMQHYAWALRRVHASVGNPQRRLRVATIAASMLLGFYEIVTADHMKWNMHLAGSKQLFVETDFVQMTKEFRRLKKEKAARYQQMGRKRRHSSEELYSQDDLLDQIPDVDERMISHMTGKEVRYDDHGGVDSPMGRIPRRLDLGKFEILKDLYWWYCKQDVIQSILSGNPLLMDFSRWANCPPRAPLGKADAVHGSFDHLILLLGRIAEFSSRDRTRKLKQIEANGGQWRPAPGMNIPRPPATVPSAPVPATGNHAVQSPFVPPTPSNPSTKTPTMPPFFGMAPPPNANVHMPYSYTPLRSEQPSPQTSVHSTAPASSSVDHSTLQNQTALALEEYSRIRAALHTFATSLGDAFEPLSSEYQTPLTTSFGTARVYRSYDIGVLWAVYNMAMIIAIRSHPHMPPAAHMAAAIAAQSTHSYAQEIGRITAGMYVPTSTQPLNPALGAALCESCMPSFFAAVQYSLPAQRYETVSRIWDVGKRTGWGSVELIANGCETAWVKAAEGGRGPPYERIVRQEASEDPRMNGSWEKLDKDQEPDEKDEGDRRLVKCKSGARLHWAIGVMGGEEDVKKSETKD